LDKFIDWFAFEISVKNVPCLMSRKTARAARYGLTESLSIIGTRIVGAAMTNGIWSISVSTISACPIKSSP
jgi:hypothetical protein